jgi:hypothetical protein
LTSIIRKTMFAIIPEQGWSADQGNNTIIQSKYPKEYGATIGNLLYNYELK